MLKGKKVKICIAEMSPIVSTGLAGCLKRLKGSYIDLLEVHSQNELWNLVRREVIDVIIINPTFGGIFNPVELKEVSINNGLKIAVIEIGRLSRQITELYDAIIHVTDDLDTLDSKLKEICLENSSADFKESLSQREKEIISLVVKGLTNQEIADKLFLSIHTVITHRRNIARKLEIHSATGLTIYAIVNKIVDISEIKI